MSQPLSPRARRTARWLPLLLIGLAACGDGGTGPDPAPDRRLQLASAAPGDRTVGAEVPLAVRVTDDGVPAAGVQVIWEAAGGDGGVAPRIGTTDGDGRSEAVWMVGTQAGPRSVSVEAAGAEPLFLEARALPGEAVAVRFPADTLRLTARRERKVAGGFEDAYGNQAAPPAGVSWSVDDPSVASVDAGGWLKAEAQGATRVRAESALGSASAAVVVEFRGVITITFDDGFLSAYTRAFPVMAELGLLGNVAVVTKAVDEQWGDFATLEQLHELHDAGWAMVSHTLTHDSLTSMSDTELEAQLADSRAWLEEQEFRGSGVFVVPFHLWGARERAAVARHYDMARGTSAVQFFPDTLAQWLPDEPYGLTALEAEYDAPMSTPEGRAAIREMMERAVEEGLFLELFFHDVTEEMMDDFTLVMEIAAEFAEHVVPYDEVLATFVRSEPLAAPWAVRRPLVARAGRGVDPPPPLEVSGRMRHLAPDQIDELQRELARQLHRLERSMRVTESAMEPVALDQTAVGRLSRIDSLQNQGLTRNLQERERMKLAHLQEAFRRLEAGTYGVCVSCEGQIPFERLFVVPETPTCTSCT